MKIIIVSFLIFVSISFANAQKNVDINGVVVDENGNPISNAVVSWRYEPEETVFGGSTYASILSLNDGQFGFSAKWYPSKKIRVFIESPISNGCAYPLDVTSPRVQKYIRISSVLISEYSPEIFLGEVNTIGKYGTVEIKLNNADNTLIEQIKGRFVYLEVKNKEGQILSKKTVNSAYDSDKNILVFCLPSGDWILNFTNVKGESLNLVSKSIKVEPNKIVSICIL